MDAGGTERWYAHDGRRTKTNFGSVRGGCVTCLASSIEPAVDFAHTLTLCGAGIRNQIADAYGERVEKYDGYIAAFGVRVWPVL